MKRSALVLALMMTLGTVQTALAQETIPAIEASKLDQAKRYAYDGVRPDARAAIEKKQVTTETNGSAKTAEKNTVNVAKTTRKPPEVKKPEIKSPSVAQTSVVNRNTRIVVTPGNNVVIPIAQNQPNRLMTPFKNPVLVTADLQGGRGDDCGEACARGRVVYVTTEQTKPVTVFISEEGREDVAISLTMVPERIAPRQVELLLPKEVMETLRVGAGSAVVGDNDEAKAWERSQPYVDMIRQSFRTIALGEVPQGYSLRRANGKDQLPFCQQTGLKFNFANGQVLEGHDMTVFVGTMKNIGKEPVEFNEMRCGYWNVAAVTSYPLKVLRPKQATEVYVAVKREKQRPAGTVRKPLIDREFQ